MRFIFIVLFLVSFGSVSMGGICDVYYCDETINLEIQNHKIQKYKPGKFKFKWEENQIKFGSEDHWFKNQTTTITKNWPSLESFILKDEKSITSSQSGDFYFFGNYLLAKPRIIIITATCSKF